MCIRKAGAFEFWNDFSNSYFILGGISGKVLRGNHLIEHARGKTPSFGVLSKVMLALLLII